MLTDSTKVAQIAYAAVTELKRETPEPNAGWDTEPDYNKLAIIAAVEHTASHPYEISPATRFQEAYKDFLNKDGWVYGDALNEETKTHPLICSFEQLSVENKLMFNLYAFCVKSVTYPIM